MTLLQALILGIIQGATEFIPVSSSGHLVLAPWLLGWQFEPKAAFVFDVLVQWGTLVAVILSFWRELLAIGRSLLQPLLGSPDTDPGLRRLGYLILLATLPAALAGLAFKGVVERVFAAPAATSGFLLATAGLLLLAELRLRRLGRRTPAQPESASSTSAVETSPQRAALSSLRLRGRDALLIGLAQALALFPGVSRSGATIAAGLWCGLGRPAAARFSFLMATPIMIGAGLLALQDLMAARSALAQLPTLLVGFLAAAGVGAVAIRWLLGYLARRSLMVFSLYCAVAGLLGLLVSLLRG